MDTTVDRTIEISVVNNSKLTTEIKIPDSLQILENPRDKPSVGFGCFRVMTPKDGDKRVVWDKTDFTQIVEAKEMFDKLIMEGLVPYRVGINGQASSEPMDEFDPHAEEVIFMPIALVAGG
jgi:hypothetical protein